VQRSAETGETVAEEPPLDLETLRPWGLFDAVSGLPDGVSELLGLYCNSADEVLLLLGHRDRPLGITRLAGLRLMPTPALPPGSYALLPLAVDVGTGAMVLVGKRDELGPLAA